MTVEITVAGITCKASTDYVVDSGLMDNDKQLAKAAIFARLCNEARAAVHDLIASKYGKPCTCASKKKDK